MKYEEAYCATLATELTIDKVTEIFATDPHRYARDIADKLSCPGCRLVSLSYVSGKRPHFRGFPNADHDAECFYKRDEMTATEVTKLMTDSAGGSVIAHQMDRLLIQYLKRNASNFCVKPAIVRAKNENNDISLQPKHRWQIDKRFPQKQINAPFTSDDYGPIKLFYGEAHIKWEATQDGKKMKLLIKSLTSKRLICKLYVTDKVYNFIPQKHTSPAEYDAFVILCASLSKPKDDSSWSRGNLIRSNYLSIVKLDELTKK